MPESKASNAVMAIARTKYGNRITNKQLLEMSALQNVGAVADYLKNTKYGPAIAKSGITEWRRGSLERIIKINTVMETYKLCAFEKNLGSPVFYAYMLYLEGDEIVTFLRYFAAGHPERYILSIPEEVGNMTEIDLVSLSQVRERDKLAEFFKECELYAPLAQSVLSQLDDNFDITPIEVNLDRLICERTVSILKKSFSGAGLVEMLKLFMTQYEVDDIDLIYRSKRFFGESKDILRSLVIGKSALLNGFAMQKLIECDNVDEFFDILKNTKYGRYASNESEYLVHYLDDARLASAVKSIHFSSNSAAVVMAYIIYLSVERKNLTHIIEGVRYKLPADKISKMLILKGQEE